MSSVRHGYRAEPRLQPAEHLAAAAQVLGRAGAVLGQEVGGHVTPSTSRSAVSYRSESASAKSRTSSRDRPEALAVAADRLAGEGDHDPLGRSDRHVVVGDLGHEGVADRRVLVGQPRRRRGTGRGPGTSCRARSSPPREAEAVRCPATAPGPCRPARPVALAPGASGAGSLTSRCPVALVEAGSPPTLADLSSKARK